MLHAAEVVLGAPTYHAIMLLIALAVGVFTVDTWRRIRNTSK